jgi:hypothetical protein
MVLQVGFDDTLGEYGDKLEMAQWGSFIIKSSWWKMPVSVVNGL